MAAGPDEMCFLVQADLRRHLRRQAEASGGIHSEFECVVEDLPLERGCLTIARSLGLQLLQHLPELPHREPHDEAEIAHRLHVGMRPKHHHEPGVGILGAPVGRELDPFLGVQLVVEIPAEPRLSRLRRRHVTARKGRDVHAVGIFGHTGEGNFLILSAPFLPNVPLSRNYKVLGLGLILFT